MNKLIISGRLTEDPRAYFKEDGDEAKLFVRFTIASSRMFKQDGEARADFIPCAAFGRTAEIIKDYVYKGSYILLTGSLRNNNYEDRNGKMVYGYRMAVETVELLDKKKKLPEPAADGDGYLQIPDELLEEMPFQ